MYKTIIFSLVLFIPFMLFSQSDRINVPDDFAKIQDAIDSSVDGDTILVAPGSYYENVNFRGKNVLVSSYYLFDEDVSFINTTIIDGSNPQSADSASVVLFLSGEKNTAILQGFTITGGKGTVKFDTRGGFFVRLGGGIIIYNSSPTIRHNIIAYNESINAAGVSHNGGGGIAANTSNAIISNNIIFKNNAHDGGGVVLGPNPGLIFRNNIIAYNTTVPTGIGGGGLFIFGPQGRFINNTIAFNHSNRGGGIEIEDNATVYIENGIIYGNRTGSSNTQIAGSGTFNITNTNIEGGWAGAGNIDEDPLFMDNTPLILQDGSPCVDKGDTSTANYDWEDPDIPGFALSPALGTLRNDMGAYGGNQYKSMPHTLFARNNRINVPDDFTKIQDAINNSVDGDVILVAPGTYYENINFRGKNVLLSSRYLFDEDVSFINSTIIDGSNPLFPDTASVVIFMNGEENTAILQGFTMTGGKGTIYLDPTVNLFVRSGGGVLIEDASQNISHNIIAYNEAINTAGVSRNGGGGITAQNTSAIISNNIIYKNNSGAGGGVLLGENPDAIFMNNVIAYNENNPTSLGGGGVFIRGTQGKFMNNTIAYNHSDKGGGIDLHKSPTTFNVENCIIYANTTGSTNTQIAGLTNIKITNTNIEGGWTGAGNIDEDPLFIENTPLILQEGSPCVDKGDTSAANYDWEDPDKPGFALSPALGTLRNDMGAYGGNQYKSMPFTSLEITGIKDENETIPDKLILRQNYPNPFNPATTISYSISEPATISLKVYDILGKEVITLLNEYQTSGNYKIEFDASSLSSGVYFYKMEAGAFSEIRKLSLIK
jgi:hypothetical protein